MKRIIYISCVIFILYFFLLCQTTHLTPQASKIGIYINDYWDRGVYFQRGSWYALNKIPYKEVFSEYPPLATYFFALPFVFLPKYHVDKIASYFSYDSFLSDNKNFPIIKPSSYKSMYMLCFSFLMGVLGFVSVSLLLIFLKGINKNLNYSLLFLFPATLFFTFNRFDILPSSICLVSLYCMFKERYVAAAILLGFGAMTKSYPLLFFPVYSVYYYEKFRKVNIRMIIWFILAICLVSFPVLIKGGIQSLKVPFSFQLQRASNYESFYYLVSLIFPRVFVNYDLILSKTFLNFSFAVLPFVFTAKINNFKLLIKWSLLSVLVFIFFMKFYSPQWILWAIFLMILNIENIKDIIKIILFQIITYIEFPVTDQIWGQPSSAYVLIVSIKSIILLSFIISLMKELLPGSNFCVSLRKLFIK